MVEGGKRGKRGKGRKGRGGREGGREVDGRKGVLSENDSVEKEGMARRRAGRPASAQRGSRREKETERIHAK
jgi:hypothetical protein